MSASRETPFALAVSSEAEKADVLDELVAIDHELQDRAERVARSRLSDVETDGVASAVTAALLALDQKDLAANAGTHALRIRRTDRGGVVPARGGRRAVARGHRAAGEPRSPRRRAASRPRGSLRRSTASPNTRATMTSWFPGLPTSLPRPPTASRRFSRMPGSISPTEGWRVEPTGSPEGFWRIRRSVFAL
jgi:hypothetical protein